MKAGEQVSRPHYLSANTCINGGWWSATHESEILIPQQKAVLSKKIQALSYLSKDYRRKSVFFSVTRFPLLLPLVTSPSWIRHLSLHLHIRFHSIVDATIRRNHRLPVLSYRNTNTDQELHFHFMKTTF